MKVYRCAERNLVIAVHYEEDYSAIKHIHIYEHLKNNYYEDAGCFESEFNNMEFEILMEFDIFALLFWYFPTKKEEDFSDTIFDMPKCRGYLTKKKTLAKKLFGQESLQYQYWNLMINYEIMSEKYPSPPSCRSGAEPYISPEPDYLKDICFPGMEKILKLRNEKKAFENKIKGDFNVYLRSNAHKLALTNFMSKLELLAEDVEDIRSIITVFKIYDTPVITDESSIVY